MYLGRIAEMGDATEVFEHPLHPYTQALLSAIPLPDPDRERASTHELLRGDPPSPANQPTGCAFHPRCPNAAPECTQTRPDLTDKSQNHSAACLLI